MLFAVGIAVLNGAAGGSLLEVSGFDPSGANGVDPDVGSQTNGECMGQGDECAFGGGIGFAVGLRLDGTGGCDVDDAAIAFPQHRNGGSGAEESTGKVAVDPTVPGFEWQVLDGAGMGIGDACIVHQQIGSRRLIRSALPLPDLFKGMEHGILDPGVSCVSEEITIAAEMCEFLGCFGIPVNDGHPPVHAQKVEGGSLSDTLCSSGDDGQWFHTRSKPA